MMERTLRPSYRPDLEHELGAREYHLVSFTGGLALG
jgi:hypothetical protein